jgi:transposase
MENPNSYRRFCGIDVGKNKHSVCVVDQWGQTIVNHRVFFNDIEGYRSLLEMLDNLGRKDLTLAGMEASGHYWFGLHDFLARRNYHVVSLNAIQTAVRNKIAIRKCKTDKKDAHHIAHILRNGQFKTTIIPTDLGMTCRQISRLHYKLVKLDCAAKQLLRSRLHPIWPEYAKVFSDIVCNSSKAVLLNAPTPKENLALSKEELSELLKKASRGRVQGKRAKLLRQHARDSVGMQRGLEGMSTYVRLIVERIRAGEHVREKIDIRIRQLAAQLPEYMRSLPGSSDLSIVSLYGETDPFSTFTHPGQLVAMAGIDPHVYSSGQFNAPRRKISKRGSAFLRKTLWSMAFTASRYDPYLKAFYDKKKAEGKHHSCAVIATARKMCHLIWRVMTDKTNYAPGKISEKKS